MRNQLSSCTADMQCSGYVHE